jgi:DNA uptake protein ComE-like DNA-binding protein
MPTPGEKRALIFLASIAALGVAVRGVMAARGDSKPAIAGDRAGLARQIVAVDSAIASGGAKRGRGASARVQRRSAPKPGADSGYRAPSRSYREAPSAGRATAPPDNRDAYWRAREHVDSLQGAINARTHGIAPPQMASKRSAIGGSRQLVDLDVAMAPEIATVPFIGLSLATKIVADRDTHGAFGSLQELERVSGVGAVLAKKLQPYVTFSLPPRLGGAGESIHLRKKPHRESR